MTLPARVVRALSAHFRAIAATRPPDFCIGGVERPYIKRWHLTSWTKRQSRSGREWEWRQLLPNVYLHEVLRSDDDRALHDHPWCNLSIVLSGRYVEHTIAAGGIHHRRQRRAGAVVFRFARAAHRLEIMPGERCWTLFLTGPKTRAWGFHCAEQGWRHWRKFTGGDDGSVIGRGCG